MAITDYIPQRTPFVMVDELLMADAKGAATRWTIPADCMLLEGKELQAAGVTEHVAQSAAAWIGKQTLDKHEPVRIGYIGAVKKMTVHRLPQVGETIQTRIDVVESVFDITLIRAVVKSEQTLVAEMELKIALQ